jgi:hypothetical protein
MQGRPEEYFEAKVLRMWEEEKKRAVEIAKKEQVIDVEAIADWLIKEILEELPTDN